MRIFQTSDGYMFYEVDYKWVDSLEPNNVDMTFIQDLDGWPVDCNGVRLEGKIVQG